MGLLEWLVCGVLVILGITVIVKVFDFISALIEFTGIATFMVLVGLLVGFCLLVYFLHAVLY